MDEFARAATIDDLKSLIKALNDNEADYLLIGAKRGHVIDIEKEHAKQPSGRNDNQKWPRKFGQ